jgi:Predicted sugar phosphate isomerase
VSFKHIVFAGLFLGLGIVGGAGRAADAPIAVSSMVGVDEVFAGNDRQVVYGLELAFPEFAKGFDPVVEALVNGSGAAFVGGGVAWRHEVKWGLGLRVAAAPGVYDSGDGRDLGGHFQILSFVEGTWRVSERGRLGLRLAHLSNASTRAKNPGTEILGLSYTIDWR